MSRAAGTTIRKLTLLMDEMQAERKAQAFTVENEERWRKEGRVDLYDREREQAARQAMARLDTKISDLGRTIASLSQVYADGWLDKPAAAVIRGIIR